MNTAYCYCGSAKNFEGCCKPVINFSKKAKTAEALMRSRYLAYAIQNIEYLLATTHRSQRKYYSKEEILNWSQSNKWIKLEILKATEKTVEFKAYFLDAEHCSQIHHEFSHFIFENETWLYVSGDFFY